MQLFQQESIWTFGSNNTSKETAIQGIEPIEKQNDEPVSMKIDLEKKNEVMNENKKNILTVPNIPDIDACRKDLEENFEVGSDNQLDELPDASILSDVPDFDMDELQDSSILPDVPDFDMDELPIFSKEAVKQPMDNKLVEANDIVQSQGDSLNGMSLAETDSASLQNETFIRNLDSVDVSDMLDGSSSAAKMNRPTRKVVLRQRNAIQLHPFTLEQEHYKKLLGKSKYTPLDTGLNDDTNDTQFTISNTQSADVSAEEIQSSLYIPTRRKEPRSKQREERVSAPSNYKKQRSTTRPNLEASNLEASPTLETTNLTKYGLPELVVPSETEDKTSGKAKTITFAKRKTSKKKRSTARKLMRLSEPANKDIFAFDMHPQINVDSSSVPPTISASSSSTKTNESMDQLLAVKGKARSIWDCPLEQDGDDMASVLDDDIFKIDEDGFDFDNDIDNEDGEMEMDIEDSRLNFSTRLRSKKHLGLDSSDEDDTNDDSIMDDQLMRPTPTKEELDALFAFPIESTLASNSSVKRLPRGSSNEDDIVPVVPDKLEYRRNKRQRVTLQALMKNRKALKGILPASFLKIYASQIEDEMKPKKRAKPSKPTPSSNIRAKEKETPARSTEDIFASFREDESNDDTDDSDEAFDAYSTIDDYVIRFDSQIASNSDSSTTADTFHLPPRRSYTSRTNIFSGSPKSHDSTPKFKQPTLHTMPIIQSHQQNLSYNSYATSSRDNRNISSIIPPNKQSNDQTNLRQTNIQQNKFEEAIEDNTVNPLYHWPKSNNTKKTGIRKRIESKSNSDGKRKTPRSSIAIGQPSENHDLKPSFQIRDNATPQRRKKRPKRPKDDIYIHAPTFTWFSRDRSGQAPDSNVEMFFKEANDSRPKAFDDIYVGTRHSGRYTRECRNARQYHDLNNQDDLSNKQVDCNNDEHHFFSKSLSVPGINSLKSVIKRIRSMHDHDLRRVRGLSDTLYIHHRLLEPLMVENPNSKPAYQHLQNEFKELYLFDRPYTWHSINCNEKEIIEFLFSKAAQDLYHVCTNLHEEGHEILEIPHHDHFYTFVSICLTQWIPCHPYEERIQLVDLFLEHIRCLAWLIPKLVENTQLNTPWRPILKLLLFILDWTCRLHHLGIHPLDWAVTDCTQNLMDILVYIGYEDIQSTTNCKGYVVEAWICLIQIMSVSPKGCGYYFHEQTFIDQLTDSIKRKSKASSPYEYEKRKTTRLWIETLNYILDKYMLQ